MSWSYLWLAIYGAVNIILFVLSLLAEVAFIDWLNTGGATRLNKTIHWRRERREKLMRELEE